MQLVPTPGTLDHIHVSSNALSAHEEQAMKYETHHVA